MRGCDNPASCGTGIFHIKDQPVGPPPGELRIFISNSAGLNWSRANLLLLYRGFSKEIPVCGWVLGMVQILATSKRLDYSVKAGNVAFSTKGQIWLSGVLQGDFYYPSKGT